jgi:hypothetical protein
VWRRAFSGSSESSATPDTELTPQPVASHASSVVEPPVPKAAAVRFDEWIRTGRSAVGRRRTASYQELQASRSQAYVRVAWPLVMNL